MYRASTIALVLLCCTAAAAKEAAPDQFPQSQGDATPIGGTPVKTTIIKRCPDGYELIMRINGALGCAKDILPAQQ
jgi:hypothetical protein